MTNVINLYDACAKNVGRSNFELMSAEKISFITILLSLVKNGMTANAC